MGRVRAVAWLVLAASCLQLAAAQTYYYYSDCVPACAPSSLTPSYSQCILKCQDCLLYSYWYFTPYFNAGNFYDYSCVRYSAPISWWSWLLIVAGAALIAFACVYGCLTCVRRQRAQKEMVAAQVQYNQQMAGYGAPLPGYPPYGAPPPEAAPAPGYPAAAASGGYPAPEQPKH